MEETIAEKRQENIQDASQTENLVIELEKVALDYSEEQGKDQAAESHKAQETTSRRLIIYTRKHLLKLSKSPLVKPPDGMPAFKSWFGELTEQTLVTTKKETEAATLNGNGRDRRYRREAEDGDGSTRPPFRSGLSQPSQMGNFKHQPLRGTDRDRDRDTGDLRSLSDKYDRERSRGDRIGLPAHSTILRNRDRDSAPHLTTERDTQRTTNKRRNGESSEDWRRGTETTRAGRDEHHTRRDRDDRERPRSRVRDTSRQRERDSPPATRRDREDRERGDKRGDRDRDEHRQEGFSRRERDRDRFPDAEEDPRRWRDDGKRDERLASRRDKDRDRSREPGERERDVRDGWNTAEDRDGRGKRGGRDRRYDEGRDKEDKREKEKEPAWMDAYVPPSTSGGILGGKGADGEVDSIQAWKKDMKEREMKAKGLTPESTEPTSVSTSKASVASEDAVGPAKGVAQQPEQPLNEIQLFKLMIKQEEQKRATKTEETPAERIVQSGSSGPPRPENGVPGLLRIREGRSPVPGTEGSSPEVLSTGSLNQQDESGHLSKTSAPPSSSVSPSPVNTLGSNPNLPPSFVPPSQLLAQMTGKMETTGPRLLNLRHTEQADAQLPSAKENLSPSIPFEPPRQSRLLAFGAQNIKAGNSIPQNPPTQPRLPQQAIDPLYANGHRASVSPVFQTGSQQAILDRSNFTHMLPNQIEASLLRGNVESLQRRPTLESTGLQQGFNGVDGPRSAIMGGGGRDPAILANQLESLRPGSISLSNVNDRRNYQLQQEAMHHISDLRVGNPTPSGLGAASPVFDGPAGSAQVAYSAGKSSRMASYFGKSREAQALGGHQQQNSMVSPNVSGPLGREQQGVEITPESKNFNDVLNMLDSSAQMNLLGTQNQSLPQHGMRMGPSNNLSRSIPFNEPDDGRFAPDGLVPGLRPASHLARSRDSMNGPGFSGLVEDVLPFNARLQHQQRVGVEQLFSGPNTQYNQGLNGGRGMGGFQQPPMRGGPSPIGNFNTMQGPPQRLPPGLANLGGRPPHDVSLFPGGNPGNFGIPTQNLHGGLQNLNTPQVFAQLQNAGLGLGGNQGQMRGGQGQGGQLGHPMGNVLNAAEFRGPGGPGPNPLLGLGGPNINSTRGLAGINPQQLQGQMHPNMGLRQQQQHPLPPHLMQQSIPSQMQQQGQTDILSLLVNGPMQHRE